MSAATPPSQAGLGPWMRLLRISNAPTALTGSLVGAMVGMHAGAGSPALPTLAMCGAGSVLLYAGGMVMNDYFDQPIDRIERPDRPIVSGQVSETAALALGMALLATGVGTLVSIGGAVVPWVLLLLAMILAYNLLHRDPVAAPVLMASCRMLVPVIAAIACAPQHRPEWPLLAAVSLPLGSYTAMISLAARHEAARVPFVPIGLPRDALFAGAVLAALAPVGLMAAGLLEPFPRDALMLTVPALVIAVWILLCGRARLTSPGMAPRGVMLWIAAIAFVDAGSLALLAGGALTFVAVGAGALTLLMQRRVLGS